MSKKSAKIDKKKANFAIKYLQTAESYGKSDYIFEKLARFSIGFSFYIMGVYWPTWGKIELKFIGISIFARINCRIWLS